MSLLDEHTIFLMTAAAALHVSRRKRRHRYWMRAIIRNRQTYGTYNHLVRELELNDEEFRTYFRLNRHQFGEVLSVVEEQLTRRSTSRQSISAKERLAICLRKLKKEQQLELQQLENDSTLAAFTKLWSFTVEGEYYQVVLYLACDKDTVDIFCNDEEVSDVMTNVSAEGATFDFVVGASYKARISCNSTPHDGLVYTLTIDGYCVPEVE